MLLACGVALLAGCAEEPDRERPEPGLGSEREARTPVNDAAGEEGRARRRERPARGRPARRRPPGDRGARVAGVVDGDTIVLAGLGRVRLIGVDTPEVHGRAECYGREASAFTKRLLPPGKRVRYRLGVERRDRYGRLLAYVWLPDGRMVNRLLAEQGYAQPLTIPPNVAYAERFAAAARRARRAGRGLWGAACAGGGERRAPSSGGGGGGAARPAPVGGADRDCADFATQDEAQRYFESIGGSPRRNADGLDADRDGVACESLP